MGKPVVASYSDRTPAHGQTVITSFSAGTPAHRQPSRKLVI
jgi:hypothetical protein